MRTFTVVINFNVFEYYLLSLHPGQKNPIINTFNLWCAEKAFSWRVVPTITLTTHRTDKMIALYKSSVKNYRHIEYPDQNDG
jgi:hypothetical protein